MSAVAIGATITGDTASAEYPQSVAGVVGFYAARQPAELAVEFRGRTLTWGALDRLVGRLATGMIRDGIGSGDRVAHLGRNSDLMVALLFATARIGAVFTPLNWRLAATEVAYILGDSGARLIFVTDEFIAQVPPADGLSILQMSHGEPLQGMAWWLPDDIFAGADEPHRAPAHPVVQIYTSGTTGRPKGALLSDAYFVDGARMFLAHPEMAMRLRPHEFAPVTMPMFHVGGVNLCFIVAQQGRGLIIMDDYDPVKILDLIDQGRIALLTGVPAMLQALIDHPAARSTNFAALRFYVYGAAPMPPALLKAAMDVIGCGFSSLYGLTEASGLTYLAPSDHDPLNPGRMNSVGRALPGVDLQIIAADGQPLPPGEIGEIAVRSPQLFTGYWRLPEPTRDAFVNGYFKTGDAGYVDAQGYLFLKDRLKDMIISGGENIYSAEVELVLLGHPAIQDIAVVGVPDPRWGEVPKAFVVPVAGETLDFDDIAAFAAQRLAKYKLPRHFEVVDELPRNAAGKVLKRDLRARIAP